MQIQNNTRSMVEAGLLTAVAVVLILIANYVPFIGVIGMFIWPIPLSLIYIRHGLKYSVLSLIVVGIISAMAIGPINGMSLVLTLGVTGIILGYCSVKKKPFSTTFFTMSVVMFVSLIVVLKAFSFIAGHDVLRTAMEQTMQIMTKSMEDAAKINSSMGVSKDAMDTALKMFPSIDQMMMLLPASMAFLALFMSFISYIAAGKIFPRFGYSLEKIKPVSQWYIPSKVAIGLILAVLLGYGLSYFKVRNAEAYITNGMVIFSLVFMVNGIAFISYFLNNKGVSKGIRFVVYFFLITSPLINIVAYVGMFDYAIDFRKLDPGRIRRV